MGVGVGVRGERETWTSKTNQPTLGPSTVLTLRIRSVYVINSSPKEVLLLITSNAFGSSTSSRPPRHSAAKRSCCGEF